MSEPITYEWLEAHGWRKLERRERQPTDSFLAHGVFEGGLRLVQKGSQ